MAFGRLSLFSDSLYTYRTRLDGLQWELEFEYKDRLGCLYLSMYDANGDPIVRGYGLRPNAIFTFAGYGGPSGYFCFTGPDTSETDGTYTRADLAAGRMSLSYANRLDFI
jgi:hypothetical protein